MKVISAHGWVTRLASPTNVRGDTMKSISGKPMLPLIEKDKNL